jgi:GH25 family lysozyme M1 (1,4-beta-N-acetylmuramidase)
MKVFNILLRNVGDCDLLTEYPICRPRRASPFGAASPQEGSVAFRSLTSRRAVIRRAAVLAVAAGAAALALAGPAGASTTAPAGFHPAQDRAGSTIRAHEKVPASQAGPAVMSPATTTSGMDVSAYQGNVNWSAAYSNGGRFAYIKATEGTYYTNPYFAQQYNGSYNVGMIRGSYHFAIPNGGGGAAQADYFVAHGGGWSGDGKTLPGMLDIEYNPYSGGECYGLSQSSMVSWIGAFINEYKAKTSRWATIYTTTDWWSTCTGNYSGFWNNNPLFIARYASSVGTLPAGAPFWTFWQYADSGTFPGDQDYFNGAFDRLQALANG